MDFSKKDVSAQGLKGPVLPGSQSLGNSATLGGSQLSTESVSRREKAKVLGDRSENFASCSSTSTGRSEPSCDDLSDCKVSGGSDLEEGTLTVIVLPQNKNVKRQIPVRQGPPVSADEETIVEDDWSPGNPNLGDPSAASVSSSSCSEDKPGDSEGTKLRKQRNRASRWRKKQGATKLAGRDVKKGALIQASVLNDMAKKVGGIDAQKEKEKELSPQEKYLENILKMKFQYERVLAWILGTYFFGKSVHTHSWAIRGLIQRLRETGLDIQTNALPDLIIGHCGCNFTHPLSVLGPSTFDDEGVPFFDQLFFSDQDCQGLWRVVHSDSDYVLLGPGVTTMPYSSDCRMEYRAIEKNLASGVFPSLQEQAFEAGMLYDESIRSLIKPTRVFSEVTFASSVQSILNSPLRPTYVLYQADYLNQTILSAYHENGTLYRSRCAYGDRRYQYDDKLLETVSGLAVGSKGISFAFAMETWELRVKPKVHEAAEFLDEKVAQVDELYEEWKNTHDDSEEDDDDDQKSSQNASESALIQQSLEKDSNCDVSEKETDETIQQVPNIMDLALDTWSNGLKLIDDKVAEMDLFIDEIARPTVPPKRQEGSFYLINFPHDAQLEALEEDLLPTEPERKNVPLQSNLGWIGQLLPRSVEEDRPLKSELEHEKEEEKEEDIPALQKERPVEPSAVWNTLNIAAGVFPRLSSAAASGVAYMIHPHIRPDLSIFVNPYWKEDVEDLWSEIKDRDLQHRALSIFRSTNLVSKRGFRQPMQLLHADSLLLSAGFTPSPMCVTWQETHEYTEDGPVVFHEYASELEYDTSRITLEILDDSPIPCSSHSEVYYGLYVRRIRCYNQDYALVSMKKRLGRTIPIGKKPNFADFSMFCSKLEFPEIEDVPEADIVDRELYESYLVNMPAQSRNKHLTYFDSRNKITTVLEMIERDAYFVKVDEGLIDRKGRGIINPPPSLFYYLVVWTVAIKKALKRKMFNLVYANAKCEAFFTYGADMDSQMKSIWFTRAFEMVQNAPFQTICILVGGDDNLCLMGCQGRVISWESDVSACDQSHNKDLVTTMLGVIGRMGMEDEYVEIMRASYLRPLKVKDRYKVFFHKMQLHTGHPQTSLANTFLVGMMALFFAVRNPDLEGQAFVDWTGHMANKLGMEWKVQFNEDPFDSTFHKGFWVPGGRHGADFQWIPLPSCIWKAMKIRSDSYVGHRELLLRLAFNQYQRVIAPNCCFVREMCKRQFRYIIDKLAAFDMNTVHVDAAISDFMDRQSSGFQHYRDKERVGKNGEINEETAMGWDEEPWWDVEAERAFCLRRYGPCNEDMNLFIASWTGEFGIYEGYDFNKMIIRDYGTDAYGYEARCEQELGVVLDETL